MISELIKKDRTFRRFDEKFKISTSLLQKVVESLRFCHSARNQQAIVYRIVNEPQTNEKIFPLLKWAGYLTDWHGPKLGERPSAYIILGIHTQRANISDKWIYTDIGIAVEAMSLLLAEQGLGNCIFASFDKPKLSEQLYIPEQVDLQLVIAIGKPLEIVETIDIEQNQSIKYFRKGDIHIVPKRKLEDLFF